MVQRKDSLNDACKVTGAHTVDGNQNEVPEQHLQSLESVLEL
jgi:hypothetical protein